MDEDYGKLRVTAVLRPSPRGKLFDIPLPTVGHAQILKP